MPARPRHPKDKAKVEVGVLVERQISPPYATRSFFALADLNHAIRELLERLNQRPSGSVGRPRCVVWVV